MHRSIAVISCRGALATVAAFAALTADASAHHPGLEKEHAPAGVGMQVNSPAEFAHFHPGVQWDGSAKIDHQTAELVYAGTGCTPASYATVANKIRGNIALVDDRASASNPADRCPTYTFAQKAQSAEKAGAIGLVQIPREGDEPGGGFAITAGVPALEIERTAETLAVRDAVIAGKAVNATLTPAPNFPAMSNLPCTNGMAGPFPCDGMDLLSFIPADAFDGAGQSDLWGWTDPENGDEYVMLGKTNGVAFFRITDPLNPVYVGELPNRAVDQRVWHDVKVYENHAFIVSESEPHGMTVFDLTRLRGVTEPRTWTEDAFYRMHSAAHNIAINTESGFAYIVGGNAGIVAPDHCLSGLHIVDISTPKKPSFAGCYLEEGGPGTAARSVGPPVEGLSPAAYVHDAECVVYSGPDKEHTGKEVCFNAAENKIVIADVTNKLRPVTLGFTDYPNVTYAHQGSLTPDHRFLLVNDELDEEAHKTNTRTVVLDVSDLDDPKLHFEHFHETRSIDHNNYVHNGRVYQSNYTSGLRVLSTEFIGDAANPRLEPFAFFDSYPAHTDPTFNGTWSNYPYFASGTIPVSGIDEGLFLVRLSSAGATAGSDRVSQTPAAGRAAPVSMKGRSTTTSNRRPTSVRFGKRFASRRDAMRRGFAARVTCRSRCDVVTQLKYGLKRVGAAKRRGKGTFTVWTRVDRRRAHRLSERRGSRLRMIVTVRDRAGRPFKHVGGFVVRRPSGGR